MTATVDARARASIRTALLAVLALAAFGNPASAQVTRNDKVFVVGDATITLSTPITRSDCTPQGMTDNVYTLGVPSTWVVRGADQRRLHEPGWHVHHHSGDCGQPVGQHLGAHQLPTAFGDPGELPGRHRVSR